MKPRRWFWMVVTALTAVIGHLATGSFGWHAPAIAALVCAGADLVMWADEAETEAAARRRELDSLQSEYGPRLSRDELDVVTAMRAEQRKATP